MAKIHALASVATRAHKRGTFSRLGQYAALSGRQSPHLRRPRDWHADCFSWLPSSRDPGAYQLPIADLIQFGASPRATINLTLAAKAHAFLAGRGYVVPGDVKDLALDVLRHRVIITYEAEAEEKTSDDVVRAILDHVAVP